MSHQVSGGWESATVVLIIVIITLAGFAYFCESGYRSMRRRLRDAELRLRLARERYVREADRNETYRVQTRHLQVQVQQSQELIDTWANIGVATLIRLRLAERLKRLTKRLKP